MTSDLPNLDFRTLMFVLRWLFRSALLTLLVRVLGRLFPILRRLLRILWP